MRRARVLSEARAMRFEDVYGRYRVGRRSCAEPANVLGVSASSFFRWRGRLALPAKPSRPIVAWITRASGECGLNYCFGWTARTFHTYQRGFRHTGVPH
jgi:hypothetical protein